MVHQDTNKLKIMIKYDIEINMIWILPFIIEIEKYVIFEI